MHMPKQDLGRGTRERHCYNAQLIGNRADYRIVSELE